jgi:hypothetical protein
MTAAASTPLLTYEQPLYPGELRIDDGDECLAMHWVPESKPFLRDLRLMGFILFAFLIIPGCGAISCWNRHRDTGGLIVLGVFVLLATAFATMLSLLYFRRHRPNSIHANREEFWHKATLGSISLRMSRIALFATKASPDGRSLIAVARTTFREKRWLQFKSRSSRPKQICFLTHSDADLIERAAIKLNALLTPR